MFPRDARQTDRPWGSLGHVCFALGSESSVRGVRLGVSPLVVQCSLHPIPLTRAHAHGVPAYCIVLTLTHKSLDTRTLSLPPLAFPTSSSPFAVAVHTTLFFTSPHHALCISSKYRDSRLFSATPRAHRFALNPTPRPVRGFLSEHHSFALTTLYSRSERFCLSPSLTSLRHSQSPL